MNSCAFTPITDNPIVLNLEGCKDWGALHKCIRDTFGFPTYYGENWDAMWDCLTDVFFSPEERRIVVRGLSSLPKELQRCTEILRKIFNDLNEKYPWVTVSFC